MPGELDERGVAAPVQGDQNPQHVEDHRADLCLLRSDPECRDQRGLRAIPVAQVKPGAGGIGMDIDEPGGRQPGVVASQLLETAGACVERGVPAGHPEAAAA